MPSSLSLPRDTSRQIAQRMNRLKQQKHRYGRNSTTSSRTSDQHSGSGISSRPVQEQQYLGRPIFIVVASTADADEQIRVAKWPPSQTRHDALTSSEAATQYAATIMSKRRSVRIAIPMSSSWAASEISLAEYDECYSKKGRENDAKTPEDEFSVEFRPDSGAFLDHRTSCSRVEPHLTTFCRRRRLLARSECISSAKPVPTRKWPLKPAKGTTYTGQPSPPRHNAPPHDRRSNGQVSERNDAGIDHFTSRHGGEDLVRAERPVVAQFKQNNHCRDHTDSSNQQQPSLCFRLKSLERDVMRHFGKHSLQKLSQDWPS